MLSTLARNHCKKFAEHVKRDNNMHSIKMDDAGDPAASMIGTDGEAIDLELSNWDGAELAPEAQPKPPSDDDLNQNLDDHGIESNVKTARGTKFKLVVTLTIRLRVRVVTH